MLAINMLYNIHCTLNGLETFYPRAYNGSAYCRLLAVCWVLVLGADKVGMLDNNGVTTGAACTANNEHSRS